MFIKKNTKRNLVVGGFCNGAGFENITHYCRGEVLSFPVIKMKQAAIYNALMTPIFSSVLSFLFSVHFFLLLSVPEDKTVLTNPLSRRILN